MDTLEQKWKETCRIVLGEEVGGLEAFLPWLGVHPGPVFTKKSSVSGQDVIYESREYAGGRFISLDEVDFSAKAPPLGEIRARSLAELAESLRPRVCYAGNIVLGNSREVSRSSNVSDCYYVYETMQHSASKYCLKISFGRENECVFGSYGPGESAFCVSCSQLVRVKRSLEAWNCTHCSDCYYSYGLDNCQDCIFCFHLKNRRHCVGNVQLEPAQYAAVKRRLLGEMVRELREKKSLPTLMDIAGRCASDKPAIRGAPEDENSSPSSDRRQIEGAFSQASKTLFEKPLSDIDDYGPWLLRHVKPMEERRSAISAKPLGVCPKTMSLIPIPKDRVVGMREADAIGQSVQADPGRVERICLSNAHELISKLAYFDMDFWIGQNSNIVYCVVSVHSSDCYRMAAPVYSKLCAYSFWCVRSESCFGCDTIFDSSCCVNCYYSLKLTRCFELDSSRDCSDCLFSHNIENCQDCMFCFNVKAKRYAIGNVEMKKEDYLRVKKMLLAEIAHTLGKDKKLDLDIYNVGAKP
ncbi:Uncharacterised protein [uncultured archaeon]|nr:Uncharacterised protein [uncultured archaeon]